MKWAVRQMSLHFFRFCYRPHRNLRYSWTASSCSFCRSQFCPFCTSSMSYTAAGGDAHFCWINRKICWLLKTRLANWTNLLCSCTMIRWGKLGQGLAANMGRAQHRPHHRNQADLSSAPCLKAAWVFYTNQSGKGVVVPVSEEDDSGSEIPHFWTLITLKCMLARSLQHLK